MDTTQLLRPLASLKNELLIFNIAASGMTFHYGAGMVEKSKEPVTLIGGVIMHFAAIGIIVGFGRLYIKTLRHLPATPQEKQFESSAEHLVAEHNEKLEEAA